MPKTIMGRKGSLFIYSIYSIFYLSTVVDCPGAVSSSVVKSFHARKFYSTRLLLSRFTDKPYFEYAFPLTCTLCSVFSQFKQSHKIDLQSLANC